jgi:hypothetical protein
MAVLYISGTFGFGLMNLDTISKIHFACNMPAFNVWMVPGTWED